MSTSAVKIDVTIAQPFAVAGEPFSLTTSIENAHEDSIEITEFVYHIPYQMQWINDAKFDAAYDGARGRNALSRLVQLAAWKAAAAPPGQTMRYAFSQDGKTTIVSVLPSESTSYSFKALVPKWLFISGGDLTFPGRIAYRYRGEMHYAPFDVKLTLRPPLKANGIGALIGAGLGTSAKTLKDEGAVFLQSLSIEFIAGTVLAVILSVIAVVYSSRRTGDSQPILTVEDFWGGLIVGFMIGYLGHEFFQRIVPIS